MITTICLALRFAWAIPTWIIYHVGTFLLLDIPGFVLVPFAIWFGHDQPDITGTKTVFSAPRFLWIYGNSQDGYDSAFAISLHPTWPTFWRRYSWAAWRNKSSNKRFLCVSWLHPPPDPKRIRFIRRERWFLCWQGLLYRFEYTKRSGAKFTVGWRYYPQDVIGIDAYDWRRFGCGFGFRLNAT